MKSSEFLKLLKVHGWFVIRQSGSHMYLKHPVNTKMLTFPYHGSKEIKKGTMRSILKDAGIKTTKR